MEFFFNDIQEYHNSEICIKIEQTKMRYGHRTWIDGHILVLKPYYGPKTYDDAMLDDLRFDCEELRSNRWLLAQLRALLPSDELWSDTLGFLGSDDEALAAEWMLT